MSGGGTRRSGRYGMFRVLKTLVYSRFSFFNISSILQSSRTRDLRLFGAMLTCTSLWELRSKALYTDTQADLNVFLRSLMKSFEDHRTRCKLDTVILSFESEMQIPFLSSSFGGSWRIQELIEDGPSYIHAEATFKLKRIMSR